MNRAAWILCVPLGFLAAGCQPAETTTTSGPSARNGSDGRPPKSGPPPRGGSPTGGRFSVGQIAPEIEAEDMDGVTFKLSDYRGKVVLLDFWGDW